MLKDSLSTEKSQSPLTKEMVERIVKKNLDFFKSKGLTPLGKPFSNQRISSAQLVQKAQRNVK